MPSGKLQVSPLGHGFAVCAEHSIDVWSHEPATWQLSAAGGQVMFAQTCVVTHVTLACTTLAPTTPVPELTTHSWTGPLG